jgi:hypothetical protein
VVLPLLLIAELLAAGVLAEEVLLGMDASLVLAMLLLVPLLLSVLAVLRLLSILLQAARAAHSAPASQR